MLLVVDNGSIYTKQLTDFLSEKNISFEKYTPHILELNSLQKYDSIILSGRRKNDKKINEVNSKIINFSINNSKKLLGICYGAEILALTLGGTIRKTKFIQKGPENIEIFTQELDTNLKNLNSDYAAKRTKNLILKSPEIIVIQNNEFYTWLKQNNRLGGQYKIPRLCNDRKIAEEILSLL